MGLLKQTRALLVLTSAQRQRGSATFSLLCENTFVRNTGLLNGFTNHDETVMTCMILYIYSILYIDTCLYFLNFLNYGCVVLPCAVSLSRKTPLHGSWCTEVRRAKFNGDGGLQTFVLAGALVFSVFRT